jgi:hypothetical protein
MHLWKKVILFSLSLTLMNCSTEIAQEKQAHISPEDYLFQLFSEWPNDLEAQIDSISSVLSKKNSEFEVLNFGNSFEENSILIVGKQKSTLQFVSDYFNSKSIATTHYDDYHIWSVRNAQEEIKSVSHYPHPILNWVIEIKR